MTAPKHPRPKRHAPLANVLFALLVTLPMVGCGRWEREHYPTPWVAPDRQVTPYFHYGSDPGLGRMEWRDTVQGRRYDPYRLSDAMRQFMERRRMFASWPPTNLTDLSEKTPMRVVMAPFRFTLVSVDPMVVLATPWPFDRDTREFEMPGRTGRGFPGIRPMRNRVELGTTAPFADGMQFFLPAQDAGPTAVAWTAGEASIPLGASERLLLTRRDSVVETRRVAK